MSDCIDWKSRITVKARYREMIAAIRKTYEQNFSID